MLYVLKNIIEGVPKIFQTLLAGPPPSPRFHKVYLYSAHYKTNMSLQAMPPSSSLFSSRAVWMNYKYY
jgi:hypothetical protein